MPCVASAYWRQFGEGEAEESDPPFILRIHGFCGEGGWTLQGSKFSVKTITLNATVLEPPFTA